ncbi:cell wall metabolism sensor histidine kinase WalK [Flavobacterium sp. GT3R68]|uniref:sensor histidine kinase n=1 Tax=Flavobacterium sp. GT3R68 TaxID=2594437 RepID=UPI000F89B918|nr:HAMP domain-containing sensor histidine kinase [Flavobacterium sp. GT3R68]RTY93677.1 HAMP domain-containing histidine kinase [Flavobacterium sp. GSN2]TRW91601.1 HAMP domain-containing histidine kinase [Flavobacterium sp. GT3R68]
MQQLSFKNRIAFNYLISTALMVLFVFVIIYFIVSYSVYSEIDSDINAEAQNYLKEIEIKNNSISMIDAEEWKEKEHNTLSVNPVFVEILSKKKEILDKSPNLKNSTLQFNADHENFKNYDAILAGKSIRQRQFSILHKNRTAGYILIAMSSEDANLVLRNLNQVLWISYPIILVLLFCFARFVAGRSIIPIKNITHTASVITKENLSTRINLPHNKDELYVLVKTINDLLDRLENAIEREKQFTSDASHELRTPLTVIKGTLEVLIRKPRDHAEYEEKINYCITEVDRLDHLVDQLLLLARFENQQQMLKMENVCLNAIILDTLSRHSHVIQFKNIQVSTDFNTHYYVNSDFYLLSIIVENLISNGLKYTDNNGFLKIGITQTHDRIECAIADSGIGIPKEEVARVFDQFYRSRTNQVSETKGNGLGLSIVKRLCLLLNIDIELSSQQHVGTTVICSFPKVN